MLFDTAEIPWWAWVRRFHLPEAEKLNGRAAMVGYVLALFVDQLTGESQLGQVAARAERGLLSGPCVAGPAGLACVAGPVAGCLWSAGLAHARLPTRLLCD